MPIMIPNDLPARATLEDEGVMVIHAADAVRQDIRPMRIGLLNLMPNKIKTETQIARLLGATPLQIELTLVKITHHVARNTPSDHIISFYRNWEEIKSELYDGFIITGAPIETMPFEEVTYWDELCRIFDWTQTNVHSTLNICWGAQAALNHFYGVPKHQLCDKAFGVFVNANHAPTSPYLRGFSDQFSIPVSRWTETRREDIPDDSGLRILIDSDEVGLCLLEDPAKRALHMFNHIEYDTMSLSDEYVRDLASDQPIGVPRNYFPNDDDSQPPENRWRSHAHLLFGNWINELYQNSPFDITQIGKTQRSRKP